LKQWLMVMALAGSLAFECPAQSLWTAAGSQERSWISDHSALRIGDIVTVVIEERQTIQDDGKVELSKESELDSAIQVLDLDPDLINTLPAVRYTNERNLNGETKYQQLERWETKISCIVIDVKPNGDLLIEGHRATQLDGEFKDVHVRGLVRPVDVSADNTVPSSRIANASLLYDIEGERSYHTEKGWLEIVLDWIWPF